MGKLKRFSKAVLATLLCAAMLAACASTPESGGTTAPDASGNTASGPQDSSQATSSKDTLVVVANQEIVSVDPADQAQLAASQLLVQMTETLMIMGEDQRPQLHLAESVDAIDETTYEIKVKEGITFHNGEELKASDCVFSLSRAMENSKTATTTSDFDPDGFEIIDDYTFRMKTVAPHASFYTMLAHTHCSIVSEKAVNDLGDSFGTQAQGYGTGAYQFVDWIPGVEIKMEAYDGYWGETAKIKNIEWKFVEDSNSRNIMLEAGEADIIYQVPVAGIEALIDNPDVEVQTLPSTTIRFIYFNQSSGMPLENKALREAISYAINREGLVKTVFGDYAVPASCFLGPGILGHTEDAENYSYDPDKAREKLAEAGYEPGELNIKLSMMSQNVQNNMAEIIQANLADIGINMEIEGLEAAAWIAILADGISHMGFNTNSNTRADPDVVYTPLHSDNIPAPNHGCVNDPRLDELIMQGRRTFDTAEREKIYVEIQQIAQEEAYYYPICFENIIMANRAELKNFKISPTAQDRFNVCYFE